MRATCQCDRYCLRRGVGENSWFTGQLEIHQTRPDAVAVLHEHSPWAQIWASQPRLLEPFNTDSAIIESIRAVQDPLVAKDGHRALTRDESLGPTAKILIHVATESFRWGVRWRKPLSITSLRRGQPIPTSYSPRQGGGEDVRTRVRDFRQATPDGAENHFRPYLQQVLNAHPESRIVIAHGA
ncbi:class II aldolase/adducin family protein [Rhodococcus erythropolis]|uniref:class II aldolase/adducin family protein n=1 Tax=Rhodococcus erythropolis TaxID=1833 RepID=UPI0035567A4A